MIICPTCKEEIEDDSHYCDQCGQALLFCNQCGRVGIGRRCTHCGGLMISPEQRSQGPQLSMGGPSRVSVQQPGQASLFSPTGSFVTSAPQGVPNGVPVLTLANDSLNIRIVGINGAVIGRRKGPYAQMLEPHHYVSGVHAQLTYKGDSGWFITDKNSSNGTKVNQRPLQPDVDMRITNGDIVTLANINLQVIVR